MSGNLDIFTLLFLVLAVVIFLKLRSVLGRRTGDEQARIERYKAQAREKAAAQDNVVTLPRREREPAVVAEATAEAEARRERIRAFAERHPGAAGGLTEIAQADPTFDPEHFLKGARQAYEMIVTAFAEGNIKSLKNLLAREVYDGFVAAMSEREQRGELMDQSLVGINRADLVEAELKGGAAHLTVKFVSELISATRDKAGNIIAGDPKKIREVTDIWTFAREIAARDPNWRLVGTQAAS